MGWEIGPWYMPPAFLGPGKVNIYSGIHSIYFFILLNAGEMRAKL